MPELPEVQTVVNSLKKLKNKKIVDFSYNWEKVIYNYPSKKFNQLIKSHIINSISRKGKYIILHIDNKYLICHLRMTGYLYLSKTIPSNDTYMRCFFTLDSHEYLIFEDVRKFGGFYIYTSLLDLEKKIGIDPFDKKFTKQWLKSNISYKKGMIKHLLLNQKFICGLGNIYIDEILWKSKIHPRSISKNIRNIDTLYNNIISTLEESIKFHGTTIINFKFDNMRTGNYKNELKVYGRKDLLCYRCNKKIIKQRIAGRGTYLCLHCQK